MQLFTWILMLFWQFMCSAFFFFLIFKHQNLHQKNTTNTTSKRLPLHFPCAIFLETGAAFLPPRAPFWSAGGRLGAPGGHFGALGGHFGSPGAHFGALGVHFDSLWLYFACPCLQFGGLCFDFLIPRLRFASIVPHLWFILGPREAYWGILAHSFGGACTFDTMKTVVFCIWQRP